MRRPLLALSVTMLLACGAQDRPPETPTRDTTYPAWPAGASPKDTSVYVHNEIVVPAPPAVVWAWLVRPDLWSTWFDAVRDVQVDGAASDGSLVEGTVIRFHMIGADIRVVVRRAAVLHVEWEGGASGVHAYHTWLLEPDSGGGTRIVTDETERGPLPFLFGGVIHGKLHDAHQQWIESLGRVAARGVPPVTLSAPAPR